MNRLYRTKDGIIGGVCGGVAEYLNIDPTIVRLLTVALTFACGFSVLAYIIGWIIIPEKDKFS